MSERLELLKVPDFRAAKIDLAVFDFDGVFTDNTVYVSKKGDEYVRCFRGDGLGIKRLKSNGVKTYVLSTEVNPIIAIRCKKMDVEYRQGLDDKAKALKQLVKTLGVNMEATLYLGNDINDRTCLEIVGIPIIVADAFQELIPIAGYQTKKNGGLGAVREVCDWIVACKNYKKR